MKRADLSWLLILILSSALLVNPIADNIIHHIPMPAYHFCFFIFFGFFATMGETGVMRYSQSDCLLPNFVLLRFVIWGLMGLYISFIIRCYSGGTIDLYSTGFDAVTMPTAILISFILGITFSIVCITVIKLSNSVFDSLFQNKKNTKDDDAPARSFLYEVLDNSGLTTFTSFAYYKVLLILWLPLFTLTHYLTKHYRITASIILVVSFGIITTLIRDENKYLQNSIEMSIL